MKGISQLSNSVNYQEIILMILVLLVHFISAATVNPIEPSGQWKNHSQCEGLEAP